MLSILNLSDSVDLFTPQGHRGSVPASIRLSPLILRAQLRWAPAVWHSPSPRRGDPQHNYRKPATYIKSQICQNYSKSLDFKPIPETLHGSESFAKQFNVRLTWHLTHQKY